MSRTMRRCNSDIFEEHLKQPVPSIVGWGHEERPCLPLQANWIVPWKHALVERAPRRTLSLPSFLLLGCGHWVVTLFIMTLRILEIIFFLYFASHIPITLFIDLQALLPEYVYPQQVSVTVKTIFRKKKKKVTMIFMAFYCFFCTSWKMFWSGIQRASKTQWW